MFTIGETSIKTGVPSHTIRYYEKIGLIPFAERRNGKDRFYSEKDIRFLQFLISLKTTGMSLHELKEIVDAGCLLDASPDDHKEILIRRKLIFEKHLSNLIEQQETLNQVILQTKEKMQIYEEILELI